MEKVAMQRSLLGNEGVKFAQWERLFPVTVDFNFVAVSN